MLIIMKESATSTIQKNQDYRKARFQVGTLKIPSTRGAREYLEKNESGVQ